MATVSAFSAKSQISPLSSLSITVPQIFPIQSLQFPRKWGIGVTHSYTPSLVKVKEHSRTSKIWSASEEDGVTAVAEDETSVSEEDGVTAVAEDETSASPTTTSDQTVSVSVSPSDVLTMFFQAEGTMNEDAVPVITEALEGVEGITDLKVQVVEGISSVQLTKQTTIQATGVASSLVEIIQGSGFKLQTLNLSFQDEEDNTVIITDD